MKENEKSYTNEEELSSRVASCTYYVVRCPV